jgi:fumarylacetoacetase
VVSGHEVVRPKGQISADQKTPIWSECRRLDFELEIGAIIGKSNKMGQPVKTSEAPEHVFGFTLLNDWSARDIQMWEYVPLGPFNAKNFATTISPWIITSEALEPFKVKLPA